MLHIKYLRPELSNSHEDLYFFFSGLGMLTITDSFYYKDFQEWPAMRKEMGSMALPKLLENYIRLGIQKMEALRTDELLYIPFEFYDEYTAGLEISTFNEKLFKIAYSSKKEGGYQVVGTFSDTIRSFAKNEDTGFSTERRAGKIPRNFLKEWLNKAAQNIQEVDNFNFLYSWR